MSLQDIKQILSRLLTLNKNLDENKLNVLLEASGWEKQNKDDILSIFRIEQKKKKLVEVNNLAKEDNRELVVDIIEQKLSVVDNKELSIEISKENVVNFIPDNLPLKEEVAPEIIITTDKFAEVIKPIGIITEKREEKIIEKSKEIRRVFLLAILLIVFLLFFGYMSSHRLI